MRISEGTGQADLDDNGRMGCQSVGRGEPRRLVGIYGVSYERERETERYCWKKGTAQTKTMAAKRANRIHFVRQNLDDHSFPFLPEGRAARVWKGRLLSQKQLTADTQYHVL